LSFYTLIFDTVNTFDNNPHYIYINSPIPLQKLGSVHDELLIEQNKVKVIQRIGYDFVNEQWSVLSTPIIHELNDVLLPTFEDNTYIKVLYFDDLELIYNAEYLIKNDLTSNFATQLESSSHFKMNQNEIEAKVDKDGIISSINLSPEEIKIKAEKIKLEGLVTANENFKILLDGSIEANKGTFKGDIFLPDGGRVIGGDGVLSSIVVQSNIFSKMFLGASSLLPLGYTTYGADIYPSSLVFDFNIPEDFVVISAKIILNHMPIKYYDENDIYTYTGYSRNLVLYKTTGYDVGGYMKWRWSDYEINTSYYGLLTKITNAFGENGFTGSINGLTSTISNEIKDHIKTGFNSLKIQPNAQTPIEDEYEETGACNGILVIKGYMSIKE
jgi:hypothetical protein